MKLRYIKLKNWFLVSLMSLLGLNACRSSKDAAEEVEMAPQTTPRNEVVAMYGVPTRDYKVVDSDEGQDKGASEPVVPSQPPRDQMIAMYGVPTVDYKLKGRVLDAKGNPVKGAQVLFVTSEFDPDNAANPETDYWKAYVRRSSDTTDAEGVFSVSASDRPWEQVQVMVRDIDGKTNGLFHDELFPVDFTDAEQTVAPKGWSQGTKEKEITLTVKEK